MGGSLAWRSLLGLMIVWAGSLVWGAAAASADPGYGLCGDARVFAVHGFGVESGYGDVVQAVLNGLDGRPIGLNNVIYDQPLDYPEGDLSEVIHLDFSDVVYGEAIGRNRLLAEIEAEVDRCPHEVILLAGHSEGAWVIHDVLDELADDEAVASHIGAVALLSDPRRSAYDPVNVGTANQSNGITGTNAAYLALPYTELPAPIPARFQGVTKSWCINRDFVCDAGSPLNAAFTFTRHSQYATNGMADNGAGENWLGARAAAIPSSLFRYAGEFHFGDTIDVDLDKLGAQGPETWALQVPWMLPPGLNLTSGGHLRGTILAEGHFTFSVTITDKYGDVQSVPVFIDVANDAVPVLPPPPVETTSEPSGETLPGVFLPNRKIFFVSSVDDLTDDGDVPGTFDMFVRDRDTGATVRYPTPPDVSFQGGYASPNGRYLAGVYEHDDDGTEDIAIWDTTTGTSTVQATGLFDLQTIGWASDSSGLLVVTDDALTSNDTLHLDDGEILPDLYLLRPDGSWQLLGLDKKGHQDSTTFAILDIQGSHVLTKAESIYPDGTEVPGSKGIYDLDLSTGARRRWDLDPAVSPDHPIINSAVFNAAGNRILYGVGTDVCPTPDGALTTFAARPDPNISIYDKTAGLSTPRLLYCGPSFGNLKVIDPDRFLVQGGDTGLELINWRTGLVRQVGGDQYGSGPLCPNCSANAYFLPGSIVDGGELLFSSGDNDAAAGDDLLYFRYIDPP